MTPGKNHQKRIAGIGSDPRKILFVFGTRPEALKVAILIDKMRRDPRFQPVVCVSGQHREMLDQVLDFFQIRPDYDLRIMRRDQSLCYVASIILRRLHEVIRSEIPAMVIVQGDTTSTLAGGLAAFYHQVVVGHVEAGLRTNVKYHPFPEEINRKLLSQLADIHFAPTKEARENLIKEGVPSRKIFVTGNTAVDALLYAKKAIETNRSRAERIRRKFPFLESGKETIILVTGHRRENFGEGLWNICEALKHIALARPDVRIVYPVHMNPKVRKQVSASLHMVRNVHLLDPLDYESFVYLMMKSRLILTDSGGIQEEAPSLGKPVLVMRRVTERMEGVRAGTARLVGTDRDSIVSQTERLLGDNQAYRRMTIKRNPFGDGKASERIIRELVRHKDWNA